MIFSKTSGLDGGGGGRVINTPLESPLFKGENIKVDVMGLATGVYFIRINDKMDKFLKVE